jgi:hypothetical protein
MEVQLSWEKNMWNKGGATEAQPEKASFFGWQVMSDVKGEKSRG